MRSKTKNIRSIFIILLVLALIVPYLTFADGGMVMRDPNSNRWDYSDETNQQAFINYENGTEKMILSVGTRNQGNNLAVWIFPVPADPSRVALDVFEDLPNLYGEEVSQNTLASLDGSKNGAMFTQIYYAIIYTAMRTLLSGSMGAGDGQLSAGLGISDNTGLRDISVYEHLEKSGVVSEVITAKTGQALAQYMAAKGENIDSGLISVFDKYIGQDYSFVVSWMNNQAVVIDPVLPEPLSAQISRLFPLSDELVGELRPIIPQVWELRSYNQGAAEEYFRKNPPVEKAFAAYFQGRPQALDVQRGVFVTFPTNKIYFPLIPTSVYKEKVVPASIRVLSYVTPEIYSDIKDYAKTSYYVDDFASSLYRLDKFYNGQERNLKYTKIDINAPSKFFTQDLWIANKAPVKVYIADMVGKHPFFIGLLLLIACSVLASMLSGWILFKEWRNRRGMKKFGFLGLANCLSIIGYAIAVALSKTKEIKKEDEDLFNELEKRGYSKKEVRLNDGRKFFLVIIFSFSFLLITWLLGEALKLPVKVAFPEVKNVEFNGGFRGSSF